jgi:diguanylate cyclase (GGDEF)-like protein
MESDMSDIKRNDLVEKVRGVPTALGRRLIWLLFYTSILLCLTTVHSQEKSSQIGDEFIDLSGVELLKKVKSLRNADQQISIKLANEVLRLSEKNNNPSVNAQAHTFLGQITQQSNVEQSLEHFLQASVIYQKINDTESQILSSLDYINTLLAKKRYDEADKKIDELQSIALLHGDALSIALVFITKADGYYQQKRFDDAIEQYVHSIEHLSSDDVTTQKHLGETYKKIAQSYKRLKNREQTSYFYKKTLDVYTALGDRKLMARTLNTLAEAERYLGNLVMALDYSIRGLEIHKQLNDPEGLAKAYMGAGIIYRHIGRYEKSLKHIYEAHLYYKQINDASGIAKTSNQMGYIYIRLKQYDQARSFYQLTIDLPESKLELKTLASALREMAVIDLDAGDYDAALLMGQKAHKINLQENSKSKSTVTARIIANIYRAQQNNTQAIAYYRESLTLATEIGSKVYQIKAQIPLASILIGKNTDEAIELLKKSLALSTQLNDPSQKLYVYRTLREAEKSRGNIAESLRFAEEEISLNEIIQNQRDDNELVLAKANLYSHKMEIELESLREKTRLDQLQLAKKNNEIEIARQASTISELELLKNKYTNIGLASLLVVCLSAVIFIYRKFIASKQQNKELDYLAARDPLTNCYNRRVLFDLMNRDFAGPEPLDEYCILMIDIDHFKSVNDTYGHSAGDAVLRGVANILQGSTRQNDITARFGGEEFCVVLPRATQEQAMRIAENIRGKVESSHLDNISVTCSIGVTSIRFKAQNSSELIEQADLALFKSKSLGRNRVTLWNEELAS